MIKEIKKLDEIKTKTHCLMLSLSTCGPCEDAVNEINRDDVLSNVTFYKLKLDECDKPTKEYFKNEYKVKAVPFFIYICEGETDLMASSLDAVRTWFE